MCRVSFNPCRSWWPTIAEPSPLLVQLPQVVSPPAVEKRPSGSEPVRISCSFGVSPRPLTASPFSKGEAVKGRGDTPNEHDILTGSDPDGRFSTAGGDTTCGNWTKSGDGSAIVGHQDLQGLKETRHMKSWNSSHGSRGCSQDQLKASGGAGLVYCFAAN